MSESDLIEAVESLPPTPCESTECEHQITCTKRALACQQFYEYVNGSKQVGSREPDALWMAVLRGDMALQTMRIHRLAKYKGVEL